MKYVFDMCVRSDCTMLCVALVCGSTDTASFVLPAVLGELIGRSTAWTQPY